MNRRYTYPGVFSILTRNNGIVLEIDVQIYQCVLKEHLDGISNP